MVTINRWFFPVSLMLAALCFYGCEAESAPEARADAVKMSAANPSDWPQVLGPNRNGISAETAVQPGWGEDGPKVLWRLPYGTSFSGISVAAGIAYTMFCEGEDEFLVAFDAGSGEEIWRFRTDKRFPDIEAGDGPRSTPTIHNGRVYCVSGFGKLYSHDARSGELRWSRDLEKDFEGEMPEWGYSGSVWVDDHQLLVETAGQNDNFLAALDPLNGQTLWAKQAGTVGYSSPAKYQFTSGTQAIFFTGQDLFSLSPEDGSLNWHLEWPTEWDLNIAIPQFIPPNRLFVSSDNDDLGGVLLQVSDDGKSVTEVWKTRKMKNRMATSVYHNGYLFGFSGKFLVCINAQNGEEEWRARGYGEGTLIVANERLVVLGEQGLLAIVEASAAGHVELTRAKVLQGTRIWTPPSLARGLLYIRNTKEVVCIDLRPTS